MATKKSIYDLDDNLEDDTLRLLMNPQNVDSTRIFLHSEKKQHPAKDKKDSGIFEYKKMIEKKHPNALVFDKEGRLFVGDSQGRINVWRVLVRDDVKVTDHFVIKHKEIEGD
mmetsp:Transcript_35995/g.55291  ORF Transcript_35995/g.55291 Transcript_35995/m.55291 type:complete len:112 (-) Transcript_35995:623-958(-)